jgi:hypothetical protein
VARHGTKAIRSGAPVGAPEKGENATGASAVALSLDTLFTKLGAVATVTNWAIQRSPFGVQVVVLDAVKGQVYETGPDVAWVLGQVLEKLA